MTQRDAVPEARWQDVLAQVGRMPPAAITPAVARNATRAALRLAAPESADKVASLLIPAPIPPACRLACALALARAGFAVEALAIMMADAAALLHPSAWRVLGPAARAPGLPPAFAAMAGAILRRSGVAAP